MNVNGVRAAVKEIERLRSDDEAAHCEEDNLYTNFVEYCAREAPEPFRTVAKEILKTKEIVFERWCS